MKGDKIPGGKGDKAKPSDFDPSQLRMGIAVEMEHTKSRRLAREIAMDHLSEDPRYYTKLKKVHKESMQQVEELLQLMHEVRDCLSEATPPPFKAAERAKEGMKPLPSPALKGKTGLKATPPPIPKAKPKEVKPLATFGKKAIVHSPTPKGDKSLGIKRGFSTHTASGAAGSPEAQKALGWAKDKVQARAAKGESLSDAASEIRSLIGEARRISNQPIIRKPRKLILRPKPLVAAGSKLKPGTSAGPAM